MNKLGIILAIMLFVVHSAAAQVVLTFDEIPADVAVQNESNLLSRVWVEIVKVNDEYFEDVDLIGIGENIVRPDMTIAAQPGDHLWAMAEEVVGHYGLWHRWQEWIEKGNPANVFAFLQATLPENVVMALGLSQQEPEQQNSQATTEVPVAFGFNVSEEAAQALLWSMFLLFFVVLSVAFIQRGKKIVFRHSLKRIKGKLEEAKSGLVELRKQLKSEQSRRGGAVAAKNRVIGELRERAETAEKSLGTFLDNPPQVTDSILDENGFHWIDTDPEGLLQKGEEFVGEPTHYQLFSDSVVNARLCLPEGSEGDLVHLIPEGLPITLRYARSKQEGKRHERPIITATLGDYPIEHRGMSTLRLELVEMDDELAVSTNGVSAEQETAEA